MVQRVSDLRMKDVVSINDGKRIGGISDIEIDMDTGQIKNIVIPNGGKILGFLGRGEEFVISWEKVQKFGLDVILVDDKDLFMTGEM